MVIYLRAHYFHELGNLIGPSVVVAETEVVVVGAGVAGFTMTTVVGGQYGFMTG